jgi:Fe2+ or Zn2+ uptake regulation protein
MSFLEYFYEMGHDSAPDRTGTHCPDDLRALFRAHGLRCTRQREQIYAALAASKAHPTAEELHQTVRDTDGGLSLATIYNTLEAFTERGLCRRIPSPSGSGPSRFDADIENHAHVLLEDGRLLDVPHDLSERIEAEIPAAILEEIERRLGVRIDRVSIQLAGRSTRDA